jgi:hypothetical protein
MTIQIAGSAAIAFGQNKPHLRSLVQTACDNQGWGKMVNRPPSKHSSLERAMQTVCKGLSIEDDAVLSVRALEPELSFEATRVRTGTTRNTVTHLVSAQVDEVAGRVTLLSWNPQADSLKLAVDLDAEYQSNLLYVTPAQLHGVIANVVAKLKGVELGGRNVFYIPQSGVQTFSQWQSDAQISSYHTVPLETAKSPDTVKHILDQLNEEVTREGASVLEAAASGSVEPRSAKAMAKRARALVDKIKSYESALGQCLDWMREPLEQAESALAVTTLLSVSA